MTGKRSSEKQRAPLGVPVALALTLVAGGAKVVGEARDSLKKVMGFDDPDHMTLREEAAHYMPRRGAGEPESKEEAGQHNKPGHIRGQHIPHTPDHPTEKQIDTVAANAACMLKKTGFPEGHTEPGKPFLISPKEGGEATFINPIDHKPYHYFPGLSNWIADERVQLATGIVSQMHDNNEMKPKIEWLTHDYEKPEGVDAKAEKEAFTKYIREKLFNSGLAAPRWHNGEPMIDFDGNTCLLSEPLAEAVTEANEQMYQATQHEIEPIDCRRSNERQAVIAADKYQCAPEKVAAGANLPGESNHEEALAMDVKNWPEAEKYLEEIGMACDFVPDDQPHCSLGESGGEKKLRTKLKEGLKKVGSGVKKAGGKAVGWGKKKLKKWFK